MLCPRLGRRFVLARLFVAKTVYFIVAGLSAVSFQQLLEDVLQKQDPSKPRDQVVSRAALIAGILGGTNGAIQVLVCPLLGTLSDRLGRWPLLVLSYSGSLVQSLIEAWTSSLVVLVFAEVMGAFISAHFLLTFAYVADISTPKKRSTNFGIIGLALGIGYVLGPAIGTLLTRSGKTFRDIYIVQIALNATALSIVLFLLPESIDIQPEGKQATPASLSIALAEAPVETDPAEIGERQRLLAASDVAAPGTTVVTSAGTTAAVPDSTGATAAASVAVPAGAPGVLAPPRAAASASYTVPRTLSDSRLNRRARFVLPRTVRRKYNMSLVEEPTLFGNVAPTLIVMSPTTANVAEAEVDEADAEALDIDQGQPPAKRWWDYTFIGSLIFAARQPVLRCVLPVAFVINACFNGLFATWFYYATLRYDWGATSTYASLALGGLLTALFQGLALRFLMRWFGSARVGYLSILAQVLAFAGIGLAPEGWMIWPLVLLVAIGPLASPVLSGLMSRSVPRRQQGLLFGATSSLNTMSSSAGKYFFSFVFSSLSDRSGVLVGFHFLLGAGLTLITLIVFAGMLNWKRFKCLETFQAVAAKIVADDISMHKSEAATADVAAGKQVADEEQGEAAAAADDALGAGVGRKLPGAAAAASTSRALPIAVPPRTAASLHDAYQNVAASA